MIGLARRLRAAGVLGINWRNAEYTLVYNQRRLYPLVDDKLQTKTLALAAGIAVPELYGVVEFQRQVRHLGRMIEGRDAFVIKPAQGSGGEGILVLERGPKGLYRKPNGSFMTDDELAYHTGNILSGIYSLGGQPDKALIEYRVNFDPIFARISHQGVPDVRIISFLGVPVMIRGHAWGNLYLTEKFEGEFDQADEQSAMILAEWAAIAVENARLYRSVEARRDEMERAVHRLEATTEIARAVGGETDLARILEIVVKRGRALVEARSLLILLREGGNLVPASVAGENAGAAAKARVPIAGSIPGQVLEARKPRRTRDLDPSLLARPARAEAGVTALLTPLVFRGQALGVLVALEPLGRSGGFTDEDELVLVSFATSAAIAVATAQSVAEDRTRDSIAATERERGRWARELHDESLQSLAGLRVLLSTARRSGPEQNDRLLAEGIERVDETIAEMRRLIADLRPTTLDELGLGAALEALAERVDATGAIEVEIVLDLDFHAGRTDRRLVGEIEDTAYRLVQEALNNVARHAGTGHARVEVSENEDTLRIRVADEGEGFDPDAKSGGFGLIGMRERVGLAGGTLELESSPGNGTTIVACLPARHRVESDERAARRRLDQTA